MKTYLLSFAICLGMLSVAEARTNHNSQVHNVQTHAGSAAVHEDEVASRHSESMTQGYLGQGKSGVGYDAQGNAMGRSCSTPYDCQ